MTLLPTITGKVVGATAAALFPMAYDQSGHGETTGTMRSLMVEQREAQGTVVGIPPVPMNVAGWFRTRMPIPGTDAFVTFKRLPSLMFHVGDAVYITDWGVRIPFDSLTPEKIQALVIGQYLRLAERARRQNLTKEERGYWKMLVADSNYADFCQRTAPLATLSGIRVRAVNDTVDVLWNGAELETLHGNFARQLSVVRDGEEFLARGRFVNDSLAALCDVVPIGKPVPVDLGDLFGKA